MASNVSELLDAAVSRAVPVVRGVQDDQFDLDTPCLEFSVRGLLNHLFHVVVGFQSLAGRQSFDFGNTVDYLVGDWRDRFEAETSRLVRAWSTPSALEGVSPGMGFPQEMVAAMVLLDLTVHSWDLARATDQKFEPDPAAVESLHELVAQTGAQGRKMKMFGEPVPVPADASSFDRLLASTGRDPA